MTDSCEASWFLQNKNIKNQTNNIANYKQSASEILFQITTIKMPAFAFQFISKVNTKKNYF